MSGRFDTEAIETERLLLPRWSEADRDVFTRLATDPEVTRYLGDGKPWDEEKISTSFDREARHWVEHGFGWRAAIDKASGKRIGFIGLNYVPPEAVEVGDAKVVEIGWWLAPDFWRRGLATEGAFALRDEAFGRVGLERIIGRYNPENVASGRIMEAIGMSFDREATGRHGQVVRIYVMTKSDWATKESDGSG